ncbi:MAG: transcriptional regulator [Candidatus Heimdallarchaeota archaeon]|nr:transcriptional regulator [Candidatus Heimdallarchaeota archaeon]
MTEKDTDEIRLPPFDEIFSFSARFNILLILYVHQKIVFSKLQHLLNLTPGNLNHHLSKLSENSFISIKKMFHSTRPISIIHITEKGKESFAAYLVQFKDILNDIEL